MENCGSPEDIDDSCFHSGVSFETSSDALIEQIPNALSVFAEGAERFLEDPRHENSSFSPRLSCMEDVGATIEARWDEGESFYK